MSSYGTPIYKRSDTLKIKSNLKLVPYKALDKNWVKLPSTMLKYIDSLPAFKVYCYLCYRYNRDYEYAFPSLSTIAEECGIARSTVQKAVKYLEERRFVVKYKRKGSEWMNNCYYLRYVVETEEDKIKQQEKIIDTFEELLGEEFETEIEVFLDEDGKITPIDKDNE